MWRGLAGGSVCVRTGGGAAMLALSGDPECLAPCAATSANASWRSFVPARRRQQRILLPA